MWAELRRLLSGLRLLGNAQLLRWLGEKRQHLECLARLRESAPGVRISDQVILLGHAEGRLKLGAHAHIREGTVLAFGDPASGFGRIDVGDHTWIGQYNNLRATEGADIVIGKHCLISQFCTLVGSQHAHAAGLPIREQGEQAGARGIVIGDDVWLGAGVVVTPGVSIGHGAVIGANAVLTRSVPAGEIWAGVPARKIDERQ